MGTRDYADRAKPGRVVPTEQGVPVVPTERSMAVVPAEQGVAVMPAVQGLAVVPAERSMAVVPAQRTWRVVGHRSSAGRARGASAGSQGAYRAMLAPPLSGP